MKLALITPRHGGEIAQGPEHACRLLAEQLSTRHDVDVLTTCARDTSSWKNEYPEGADRVRGVLVRRFATSPVAERQGSDQLAQRLFSGAHSRADELEWVRRAGPWSPGLTDFLKRHHRNYDALVFFSHRHATTVHGITVAPERSLLFPWLQMEPALLRLGIVQDTIRSAAGIGYLSHAERTLLRAYTRGPIPPEEFVGIGVQPPPQLSYPRLEQEPPETEETKDAKETEDDEDAPEPEAAWAKPHLTGRGAPFRRRHRLDGRLVVYGGRVEPDNGCEELIEYFDSYAAHDGDASLVLLGVKMMKVPDEPYLRLAGVLPARERMAAFEAADVTAAPAADDVIAEPVLESFAAGTPVLASARNPAAVEHLRRSNAGLYYADREEFVDALRLLITNDRLREKLGQNGRDYIQQHFRWDAVVGRFEKLLTRVKGGR